jgi:hypothetical protein
VRLGRVIPLTAEQLSALPKQLAALLPDPEHFLPVQIVQAGKVAFLDPPLEAVVAHRDDLDQPILCCRFDDRLYRNVVDHSVAATSCMRFQSEHRMMASFGDEALVWIGAPSIKERCGDPNLTDVAFQDWPRFLGADLLGHE